MFNGLTFTNKTRYHTTSVRDPPTSNPELNTSVMTSESCLSWNKHTSIKMLIQLLQKIKLKVKTEKTQKIQDRFKLSFSHD